jgi:hypothetical protein
LRDGKLFLVETDRIAKPGESAAPPLHSRQASATRVEHWWLCDECAAQWTLVYDRENAVALSPLRKPVAAAAAAASATQAGVV